MSVVVDVADDLASYGRKRTKYTIIKLLLPTHPPTQTNNACNDNYPQRPRGSTVPT